MRNKYIIINLKITYYLSPFKKCYQLSLKLINLINFKFILMKIKYLTKNDLN